MSCGLGAVILVFMLVKNDVGWSDVEVERLTEELSKLNAEKVRLNSEVEVLSAATDDVKSSISAASANLDAVSKSNQAQRQQIQKAQSQFDALEKSVETIAPLQKDDVVADENVGEEEYIVGLRVEGQRIAILIDGSSSMTDEKLIEIIKRKSSSPEVQKRGPKWERTKRVARWLLSRLPKESQFTLAIFNDNAKAASSGWQSAQDSGALKAASGFIDDHTPSGATNLQRGLSLIRKMKPTNVYIVTDGLPTKGDSEYKSLNPFASCSSLIGKSTTISGECRLKLFYKTIADSAPTGRPVINVVLLPIEGDPEAAHAFWQWTSVTGGLTISPARSWP